MLLLFFLLRSVDTPPPFSWARSLLHAPQWVELNTDKTREPTVACRHVRYIIFCVYEPPRSVRNFYSADIIQCVYCLLQLVSVFFLELIMHFEPLLGFQHPHRHAEKIATHTITTREGDKSCMLQQRPFVPDGSCLLAFRIYLLSASIAGCSR